MYFDTKSYLKSNCNHTAKQINNKMKKANRNEYEKLINKK
jgi:hypothetical protein